MDVIFCLYPVFTLVTLVCCGVVLSHTRVMSWRLRPARLPETADWTRVRSMELECYGAYYHRTDGTTNACGWEPL
jgi:hypothetical protein